MEPLKSRSIASILVRHSWLPISFRPIRLRAIQANEGRSIHNLIDLTPPCVTHDLVIDKNIVDVLPTHFSSRFRPRYLQFARLEAHQIGRNAQ